MPVPGNVLLDAGYLWVAPVGTAEPTGNVSTGASPLTGYREAGYTENGSTFTFTPSFQPIYVEEELLPIRWAPDKQEASVEFMLAEMTRRNLALAMNLGANASNAAALLQPPAPGAEIRVMLIWDSATTGMRWLFRQCIQVNAVAVGRHKAPNKSTMPVKFQLEKPAGLFPFDVWPTAGGVV
jgi:hypothetical protein